MITKQQIADGYDKIAEKIYVSDEFYNEVMAIEKNWHGDVLDAGCGQGPVLQKLAKFLKENSKPQFPNHKQIQNFYPEQNRGTKSQIQRLVGIDISEKLLEMARQRVPEAEILKADIDAMPFPDNSFDFVIMVDVFQYLLDFGRVLEEVRRVLKPDGKFIVTVPNKNWLLFDSYIKRRKNIQPVEDHFFTFDEMAGLLKKHGFKIATYRGADCFRYYKPYHKYEMWLAMVLPFMHKRMKKIIFKAVKAG